MMEIALDGVSKVYPNGVRALTDLTLGVAPGEWLALVGPSGCGKSTTLRIIAGLETPTSGRVRLEGRVIDAVPPWQRGVAMVFQRPALFPHKTVLENLVFGLRMRENGWFSRFSRDSRRQQDDAARQVAGFLKIEDLLERYPAQLSGGQQQRVALGRALVQKKAIGLLDEPLGHLDAPLRLRFRRELPLLRSHFPPTMIVVTHDPGEALALGDRIAVLDGGILQQVDRPEIVAQQPANPFVAEFFQGFTASVEA
jgi:ABC-type sugar transport system ATPase subunit